MRYIEHLVMPPMTIMDSSNAMCLNAKSTWILVYPAPPLSPLARILIARRPPGKWKYRVEGWSDEVVADEAGRAV
jgi:hypothetical protein